MASASSSTSASQASHRARVGAIGLGLVLVLIAVASFVLRQVSHERPVSAPGGAKPDIVANMAGGNSAAAETGPLSDMGVAPGVKNESAAAH